MYQTKLSMRFILSFFSFVIVAAIAVVLSSCGGSSTPAPTTKPGSWTSLADFGGFGRSGSAYFVIGDKAYVGGGFVDGVTTGGVLNRVNDFWQFDAALNTWVQKTDFPGTARSGAVGFAIGNKGYVGLGTDGVNRLKDFWEFDPTGNGGAGSWTRIKDFGGTGELGRTGSIAFSVSGRGFVGSGFNGNALNDIWEYVPGTDTWVQRTSIARKRVNAVAFTLNNAVYVLGGSNNGLTVREVEQYDPVANTWTQKAALTQRDANGNRIDQPLSREFAVAFSFGGFGYITGGSVNNQPVGDTWQYDAATDTWKEHVLFSSKGRARDAAAGFAIGNAGYVTTGRSGSLRFDDTWAFDPNGTN